MAVALGDWKDYQHLLDLRDYDRTTIEAVVRKLTNVANSRLRSLANAGMQDSPSYRNVANEYSTARFPTNFKNLSRNQLLKQYSRLDWFLDNKTSTVKGARQVIADFQETLGVQMNKQQTKTFWSIYNKLKELSDLQTELYYLDSKQVMQETAEIITNPDLQNPTPELMDEILDEMRNRVQRAYNKKMGIELEDEFVTDEETLELFTQFNRGR